MWLLIAVAAAATLIGAVLGRLTCPCAGRDSAATPDLNPALLTDAQRQAIIAMFEDNFNATNLYHMEADELDPPTSRHQAVWSQWDSVRHWTGHQIKISAHTWNLLRPVLAANASSGRGKTVFQRLDAGHLGEHIPHGALLACVAAREPTVLWSVPEPVTLRPTAPSDPDRT